MGMKKLPSFLSHSKSLDVPKISSSDPPWPWPSCANISTLSFRSTNPKEDNFITFNTTFLDSELTPPDSFFTVSSSSSTMSEVDDSNDPVESVIRGLRSDRLFFEPERSSSLVSTTPPPLEEEEEEEEVEEEVIAYKESEKLSMESENPYEDFRRSMEEMVEAHGLNKDWEGLQELFKCYLKINGKSNHGYIMGAFIDLLVSLCFVNANFDSSSNSPTTTMIQTSETSSSNSNYSSPSSPLSLPSSSSLTTPCLSSILDHDVDDDDHNDDDNEEHVSS